MLGCPDYTTEGNTGVTSAGGDGRGSVVTGYTMRMHWGKIHGRESRNQLFSRLDYRAERILGKMDVTLVLLDASCTYRRRQSIMTPSVVPHGPSRLMKDLPFGIRIHCHRTPGV